MTEKRSGNYHMVLNAIGSHCLKMGMSFDADNRVKDAADNLVRRFTQWPNIRKELEAGGGGELKSEDGHRPKFHSLHSSAALCVNAFAPLKEQPGQMSLLGYGPFSVARFEMRLATGISSPNLDFYLEDEDHVIGIESKYTEWLSPKVPNHGGNLKTYLNRAEQLRVVPDRFLQEVIEYYVSVNDKLSLDVAQLIKHTLGLLARAEEGGKQPVLVYVYWTPRNASDLPEHSRHLAEIADFEQRIAPFLGFHALSFADLWQLLEKEPMYKDTLALLHSRYDIDVDVGDRSAKGSADA